MNRYEMVKELEETGDYRVLKRVKPVDGYHPEEETDKKIGIVLDVETTGLRHEQENIIELGMVVFEFSSDGRIFKIIHEFDQFEDPGKPIPQEITKLTGIKDEDVEGKTIDDEVVNSLVEQAVLIIAHNASFDRPFVEKRWPIFAQKYWACSHRQINWKDEGVSGTKLEFIAFCFGYFYDAHRAIDDCWAVVQVLSQDLPESGSLVLEKLLSKAREKTVKIEAVGAAFDKKDLLKARTEVYGDDNRSIQKFVLTGLNRFRA
jgi:DNA polymerase-3 subunit epsilon